MRNRHFPTVEVHRAGQLPVWRHLVSAAALCAALHGGAWAQGAGQPPQRTLDLRAAYAAALDHDAIIKASRAATLAAGERLEQAASQLRPNASLSLGRNWNDLTSTNRTVLGEVSNDTRYFSGNQALSVRQPLYRKYLNISVDQARAQVVDAQAQLERDEQALLVRVAEGYFECLSAGEQLSMAQSQLTAYRQQLQAARQLFAAGAGTRTDVDEALARVDMAFAQELEARQARDYAVRQLEILTGVRIGAVAAIDATRFTADAAPLGALESWVERAWARSPEIAALTAQREAAELEVTKAQSGHLPTVDAVAQWSRSVSDNVTSVNSKFVNRSIGVQVSVPLYSGGYVASTIRQAAAALERAEQALEAGRRDLHGRVHREHRRVTESAQRIRALEQALASAEIALESSRRSFQAGRRSNLDVLNAEQQRAAAGRDLAVARIAYLAAGVRLRALAGDDRLENVAATAALLAP